MKIYSPNITGSLIVTSSINTITGSLTVTTAFTASGLIYPSIDGTTGQVVTTDGAGNLSFLNIENTTISIKNVSGATIQKGTPCYITGSGTSGNLAGVWPADASNPLRMPAGVIAGETLTAGSEGVGLINGFIANVNTSAFSAGNSIYVAVGGGYTNVRPTGSGVLIQKLGNVEKSHATNGSGVINGPAYYNEVPNIQQGFTWVGNSNGVATAVATSSIQNVVSSSFATTSITAAQTSQAVTFDNAGSGAASGTTFNGSVTTTISHNTIGAVPTARTITINGVSQDLSTNRTYSVGTVTSIATGNGITGGTITTTGTLGLTGQALALHNLAVSGIIARTGAGTVAARTVTGTTNQITVTNGDGVSGNPTIALPATINVNTTGNAANVTGTVAVANGGTGQTTYTNGQLLIGNTTGNTLTKATLTAGTGITITNGNGSISIAATGGGIGGSGTTNRIAKFTGATTVGTSSIDDDGTTITSLVSHTFNSDIFTDTETFTVKNGAYVFGGDFNMSSQYGDYEVLGGVTSNTNYDNIVNTWGSNLLCNGQILNDCISGEALSAGELVYMRNTGAWLKADATQLDKSTTLLGIALKTVATDRSLSILLDGIIHTPFHTQAQSATPGLPLYIDTTAGRVNETPPAATGEFVRVVGHNIHDNNLGAVAIRFQPDNTWIEL
jgi:hypothetical protein